MKAPNLLVSVRSDEEVPSDIAIPRRIKASESRRLTKSDRRDSLYKRILWLDVTQFFQNSLTEMTRSEERRELINCILQKKSL